jgi:cytochrome c oxidase subunit 1
VLIFLYNIWHSRRHGQVAGDDPWDARTLEWTIPSPPPAHNFDEVPLVHSLDDFWHRKYAEGEDGRLAPVVAGGEEKHEGGHGGGGHAIHMPSPSYFPLVAALGIPILCYGLLYSTILIVDGVLTLLVGLYGWAIEPSAE